MARAREVVERFALSGRERGLEIGTGDGTVACLVAPHCARLDGVDVSASFIEVAREACAGLSNVHLRAIAPGKIGFLPAGAFDFAYSFNVFIHLNEYEMFEYLAQTRDLLRAGGGFYFNATALRPPLLEHFRKFAREHDRDRRGLPGYMSWTDLETLRVLAAEARFDVAVSEFREEGGHLWAMLKKTPSPS